MAHSTLAVSFAFLGSLAVLVGTTTAQQFAAIAQTNVAGNPGSLVMGPGAPSGLPADLDADGDVDVLMRAGTVMRNRGSLDFVVEPFGTSIPLGTLGFPTRVEAANDVDGDGILDLLVVQIDLFGGRSLVQVLRGLPGGTWLPAQQRGVGAGFVALHAVADVDGDGDSDLLLGSSTSPIALLVNDGTGTFTDVSTSQLPPGLPASALAMADLDGDGDPDLATGSVNRSIQVLRNNGSGTFTVDPASVLPTLPQLARLLLGDLDADGDPDLLVAQFGGQPLQAFVNDNTGVLRPIVLPLPLPASPSQSLVFRDLDADGFADLLAIDDQPNGSVLQVYHNVSGALFQPRAPVATQIDPALGNLGDPALADLDRDGDLDVVVGGATVFLGSGNLNFQPLQRRGVAPLQSNDSIAAGDLDGNGILDLAIGNHVVFGEGDGYFGATQDLPANVGSCALFDADGDGDLDLAFGDATSGGLLQNQGGTFAPMPGFPTGQMFGNVLAADLDGDGRVDVLPASATVLPNLGGGAFAIGPVLPVPSFRSASAADVDADGRLDLVLLGDNDVQVLRNLGGFSFQVVTTLQVLSAQAAVAADFDGDGDVDLAVSAISSGFGPHIPYVQTWMQQPNRSFVAGPFVALQNPATSLQVADFDQDGDADLFSGQLLRNDGSGNLMAEPAVGYGAAAVADLDADGDLDVVTATGASLAVLANRHRQITSRRMPRLGAPYAIELASKPGYGAPTLVQVALAAARITPVQLGSLGTLHLDPATAFYGPIGTTGTDGVATFALQVPRDPALAGIDVFWQGIVAETGGARLTGFVHDRVLR